MQHRAPLGRRPALYLLPALLAGGPAAARPTPASGPVVAVYGDSMAQGVGFMLNQALGRNGSFRVVNRAKAATALGQPARYDWVEVVRASLRSDQPRYAVMMFGGNDRLSMRGPDSRWVHFGTEAWVALYRSRLDTMLQDLAEARVQLVWVANPVAREPRYSRDMEFLNGIYREAIAAQRGSFLETTPMFSDSQGRFVADGPTAAGAVRRLRADDGIHMTAAGYDLVAQRILPMLETMEAARQGSSEVAALRR